MPAQPCSTPVPAPPALPCRDLSGGRPRRPAGGLRRQLPAARHLRSGGGGGDHAAAAAAAGQLAGGGGVALGLPHLGGAEVRAGCMRRRRARAGHAALCDGGAPVRGAARPCLAQTSVLPQLALTWASLPPSLLNRAAPPCSSTTPWPTAPCCCAWPRAAPRCFPWARCASWPPTPGVGCFLPGRVAWLQLGLPVGIAWGGQRVQVCAGWRRS